MRLGPGASALVSSGADLGCGTSIWAASSELAAKGASVWSFTREPWKSGRHIRSSEFTDGEYPHDADSGRLVSELVQPRPVPGGWQGERVRALSVRPGVLERIRRSRVLQRVVRRYVAANGCASCQSNGQVHHEFCFGRDFKNRHQRTLRLYHHLGRRNGASRQR